ncbi:MAG TPA: hypothetical protein VGD83_21765 [Streptosporangiaceae bacterium]
MSSTVWAPGAVDRNPPARAPSGMEPHATRRAALHAGLGLSIVCSITAAHSGTVRARRPASGLIVEIDLPPAPSPAGEHRPDR